MKTKLDGLIQQKAKKYSFYITLGYVGLGTISLLAMTSSIMENDFTSILFMVTGLLTMPVSFLGFRVLWGGGENARILMLIAQLGVFAVFWYATFWYLVKRYRSLTFRFAAFLRLPIPATPHARTL